jgi:hypothetical protein
MIRRVGDFVGRRAELRPLLRELRGGKRGVVLHGIGGIGKSSLAVQLVAQLGEQAGLVVPIVGHTRVDVVLDEIRQRLLGRSIRAGVGEMHPHRQVSTMLTDAIPPWEQPGAMPGSSRAVCATSALLSFLSGEQEHSPRHRPSSCSPPFSLVLPGSAPA